MVVRVRRHKRSTGFWGRHLPSSNSLYMYLSSSTHTHYYYYHYLYYHYFIGGFHWGLCPSAFLSSPLLFQGLLPM
jgi:hypothetical protein